MNISFFYTQDQIRARTKTETSRRGWDRAKAGMVLDACEKCQGLKKGEHVIKICKIKITKVENITVHSKNYTQANVNAEGFPGYNPIQFVFGILQGKCGLKFNEPIKRITFEYVGKKNAV